MGYYCTMESSKSLLDNGALILMAIITLGMAPYVPEPHIWGKVKWLLGGGEGMSSADYFDAIMHGTPWILGIIYLIRRFRK